MNTPCSPVHFFVDVSVARIVPTHEVVEGLRDAVEFGYIGRFDVSYKPDITTVRFERICACDFIRHHVEQRGCSVPEAAQLDLAEDLDVYAVGPVRSFLAQLSLLAGTVVDPHQALDAVYATAEA